MLVKKYTKYLLSPCSEDITPIRRYTQSPSNRAWSQVSTEALLCHQYRRKMQSKNNRYRTKGRAMFLAAIMVMSVFAVPLAFAGAAAAQTVDVQYEVDGSTQSIYYQGQEINATGLTGTGLDGNESYQLRAITEFDGSNISSSTFVTEFTAISGNVTIETDNLDTGDYFLRGPAVDNETRANSFELTEQSLAVEFDEEEVTDTGNDALVDLEIDSNRGTYDLNVSAEGDLDVEDLEDIFTTDSGLSAIGNNSDGDDDTITLSPVSDDDFTLNFTDVDAGDYEFTFEVDDTTAEATASITVVEGDDGELSVSDVDVAQGDIASFEVEFSNTEEGLLVIGNEDDDGYQANVSIDSDGEDSVIVHFNTYTAGNEDIDGEFIITVDEDSDATVELEDDVNLSSILDSGDYEVAVYATSGTDPSDFVEAVDDPDEIATLTITERTELDATQWRAGADVIDDLEDELDDSDADGIEFIAAGVEDDLITETDMFAVNDGDGNGDSDYQIHQISADGIHGLIANASGVEQFDDLDTTAAFIEALAQNNSYAGVNDDSSLLFEFEEQDPGPNQDSTTISLNDLAAAGEDLDEFMTVAYDANANDYYVIIDTDELVAFAAGLTDPIEIEEDQSYDVTFAVQDARLLDELDDEDDLEELYEEIAWAFDLDEAEGEFLGTNDDGDVEAELGDASELTVETNVAPGTQFDIRVRNKQDTSPSFIMTDRDVVVQADGLVTGTFDFSAQSVDDEFEASVRQASFELEEDGVIIESVEDEVDETDDADETDDVEETDDADEADDVEETDDTDEADDTTDDETPGFGALVALVALLGAALLAARRQN